MLLILFAKISNQEKGLPIAIGTAIAQQRIVASAQGKSHLVTAIHFDSLMAALCADAAIVVQGISP